MVTSRQARRHVQATVFRVRIGGGEEQTRVSWTITVDASQPGLFYLKFTLAVLHLYPTRTFLAPASAKGEKTNSGWARRLLPLLHSSHAPNLARAAFHHTPTINRPRFPFRHLNSLLVRRLTVLRILGKSSFTSTSFLSLSRPACRSTQVLFPRACCLSSQHCFSPLENILPLLHRFYWCLLIYK